MSKWFITGVIIGLIVVMVIVMTDVPIRSLGDMINLVQKSEEASELVVGHANDAIGLDPAVVTDHESLSATINLYDTLVVYNRDGSELLPSLATKWRVSENGLVWTFNLRDDVIFHDGSRLTAESVVFNFNRWMDTSSPYHAGHFSYWNLSFGGFPGIVEGVRAIADYTVEIRLTEAYAPFLSTLALPAFGIASPNAILTYNEALETNPVGSGPFKLGEWAKDGTLTLVRNDAYWGEKAKVKALVFKTIPRASDRLSLLKSGDIHMAFNLPSASITIIEESKSIYLANRPLFNVGYMAFNLENDLLKSPSLRYAIAHSIDKSVMIDTAFNSYSRPATSFVPPYLWGHHESLTPYNFDVDYAKKLVKASGYKEGDSLRLLVMSSPRAYFPNPVTLGEFIKQSLDAIGVRVILDIRPWEEVIALSTIGDYDLLLAGWNGDIPDPDNFLYNFFSSDTIQEGIKTNFSYFSDEEVDKLLIQARQVNDQGFRTSLYREIQEIINAYLPAIPLVHNMPLVGVSKRVKNYEPHISGTIPLNQVYLEGEAP